MHVDCLTKTCAHPKTNTVYVPDICRVRMSRKLAMIASKRRLSAFLNRVQMFAKDLSFWISPESIDS